MLSQGEGTSEVSLIRVLILRTDAEGEAPILWPLDLKNQFTGKDPDDGKD